MLQKKSKCRAAIITSLCSFLYVPLMIGVLSNSKPSAVSATVEETVIWTGNETNCRIANSDLPVENPEYLHIEFVNYENASIYDYEAMNEIAYLSESDHGIISLSDSQWSDIRASGGLWIFSETEPFTQISYKAKEPATNYDLWIAGIQVTSENKDDILPSASPGVGTASFDPATNTLSLNDFYIISQDSAPTDDFGYGDYKLNEIGIASKLNELTIDVTNTVQIGKQLQPGHLDEYEFKAGIISTGDLTIVGSGKFFAFGDMGSAIADNLTIDMDFGGDDDDSQLFMESNARLLEGHESDDVGTVLVNNDFNLLGGCVDINCFEENGVVSLGGDFTIKDCQLQMEVGHDCLYTVDGDLLIDNSYVGLQADIAGTEIMNGVNEEKGNALIQNNSFVYVISNENIAMGLMSNNTFTVDDSRIYVVGSEADNLMSAIAAQEFEMTGNSLIYSSVGMSAVSYEGPAKITMTGGTVITNSLYGLYGGGETEGLFVVGSEATPFAVKNGAKIDLEGELVPVDICEGIVPTYDTGYGYMSNIGPADPEENDGYVEINTYATVSMSDYEYGGTVSTPSVDHEVAELWGIEMEEVMYLYYADGETIDDAEIWDEIEPDTLEAGTYNMVAYIVDHAMPMFQYYSDPVEFEVTSSTTTIEKPVADETVFTYTGEEQTYEIADNDAYTVSDNVQTDAGEYEVTVSLKDSTSTTWDDGTTDDLTYDFVIAKAEQVIEISDITKTFDNTPISIGEKDTYRTTNYYTKLGDGAVTLEYKLASEDDSKYTTTAPKDAGNYTLRVSVAEGTNYLEGSETKDFTIEYGKISKVGFGDVAQPVAGEEAPTTVTGIAIGSKYSGTISWSPALDDGDFDNNTVYTATVTLDIVASSSENYRFADNVTLVKPTEGWTKSNTSTGTSLVYTKTFEKTGKITPFIDITVGCSKTYDGLPVSAPTYTRTGEGAVTIEYKVDGSEDSTYTTVAPTDAGDYVVRISVAETETYASAYVTEEFMIEKAQVAKPQADSSTFTYNGEDKTYDIDDSELYEISNNVQKNAGTYEVKVSLVDKDNYEWVDGTTDDVTFEFVINKAQVVKPSEDSTTFTYNGNEQTYNVSSSDHYTVSGNKATEAGNHPVTVSLNDKDNFEWSDGSVENLSFNFNINKAQVAKPNADTTSFTYNGENQTYNIPLSDAYTVNGNVQKNAGTYAVTVSLNDKNNTCWADGSSEDLTFTFVIARAKVAKPAADTSSFTYTGEDQTYNIASSDLYTVSGNVAKEAGTHQVTVSLKDINNYEWEDGTTANLTYDFVIVDKTCINHWFLIGILALGLVLVALSLFILRNSLIGVISSGVFLVGSIVSTVFCGCTICIVFAVVDLALFVGSTGMFTFKFISKNKQKDSKKEGQEKPEEENKNK